MRADPYNIKKANSKAVLQAKVNKLKQLVLKTKLPGATQKLAQIEQLPVYSEMEEVAKILKEMLSDLSTRLSVINEVDAQAKKLVDDAYAKMVEWEKKLVKLADGKLLSLYSTILYIKFNYHRRVIYVSDEIHKINSSLSIQNFGPSFSHSSVTVNKSIYIVIGFIISICCASTMYSINRLFWSSK